MKQVSVTHLSVVASDYVLVNHVSTQARVVMKKNLKQHKNVSISFDLCSM